MKTDIESFVRKEFLEHVFKRKVDSYTYAVGTKPQDNFLSCVYKVEVSFEGEERNEKATILLKVYPDGDESTCEFLDSGSLFATEYWVYDKFLPMLNEIAQEISKELKEDVSVSSARFYGGNILADKSTTFDKEPWINENFIVLEDLRPKGYKMLDRTKGLDAHHCLLIVIQLARLHALSWAHKQRNNLKHLVDKYSYLHDPAHRKDNEHKWGPIVKLINRNGLYVIEKKFGVDSDIFLRLQQLTSLDVLDICRSFVSSSGFSEVDMENLLREKPNDLPNCTEPWLVATHGDCWVNNLLFAYEDEISQLPSKVILIDHQIFREACLTTDLAYFMYSSTKPAVRRTCIDAVLKAYYDEFTKVCTASGENLPPGFNYETFLRRWRRARLFALLMTVQFVAFQHNPLLMSVDLREEEMKKVSSEQSGVTADGVHIENIQNPDGERKCEEWKTLLTETMQQEYVDGVL